MEDEAYKDKNLPILAVVDRTSKYKINVSSAPSAEVTNAISEVLDGKFLDGLKSLVTGALNTMLGNTSAGESEKRDFHVVFASNAILRLDYMCYKYTFSEKGIIAEAENCFCYYIQISILDMVKLNPQVMLYEITRAVGDRSKLSEAEKSLKGVTGFSKELYQAIESLRKPARGT